MYGSRMVYLSGRLFSGPTLRKVKWTDTEEIAEVLFHAHGKKLDPLSLRFTQLHTMVTKLPEFSDDPEKSNESHLESIQMQWHELYEETKQ